MTFLRQRAEQHKISLSFRVDDLTWDLTNPKCKHSSLSKNCQFRLLFFLRYQWQALALAYWPGHHNNKQGRWECNLKYIGRLLLVRCLGQLPSCSSVRTYAAVAFPALRLMAARKRASLGPLAVLTWYACIEATTISWLILDHCRLSK